MPENGLLHEHGLFPDIGPAEHLGYIAAGLLVYLVVTRVRQQHRHPSAAMAWVLSIVLLPYAAVPLFLAFGTRKVIRPTAVRRVRQENVQLGTRAPEWATRLLAGLGVAPPAVCTRVGFHDDGDHAWAELLTLCRSATLTLDVGTYVLGNDAVGHGVQDELCAAVRRGVRVRLLIDGIGSLQTRRFMLRQLRRNGVQVRRFMPALRSPVPGRTNLRNHRKVAIADSRLLWSGGRNLACEYFFETRGIPAWVDLSFSVHGPLCERAQRGFDADWRRTGGWRRSRSDARAGRALDRLRAQQTAGTPPSDAPTVGHLAQWVPTGPDCADDNVHALLVCSLFRATRQVLMVSPYFVPDDGLLDAMCLAARRGVDVQLLLPARSNHVLADVARARALRRLARAGGRIALAPAMIHAKACVVDEQLALCGSANLDSRSLFLNYEAMGVFYDPEDVRWVERWFQAAAANAVPYRATKPAFLRDVLEGIVLAVGFQL